MEEVFSYSGTVAGLALYLETGYRGLMVELSRKVHDLEKLQREAWPIPTAQEWRLLDDKAHDDR